jgi:hypothetical protein
MEHVAICNNQTVLEILEIGYLIGQCSVGL